MHPIIGLTLFAFHPEALHEGDSRVPVEHGNHNPACRAFTWAASNFPSQTRIRSMSMRAK